MSEPLPGTTSSSTLPGRRVALVVGVNRAPNVDIRPLDFAERDAVDVASVLADENCRFELRNSPLLGDSATSNAVQDALLSLTDELGPDDTLLFYFARHGTFVMIDAEEKDVYLVTSDFNAQHAKRSPDRHVSMRWLQEQVLRAGNVGRALILLDCCYAGWIGEVADDPYLQQLKQRLLYYLNVSNTGDQPVSGVARMTLAATSPTKQARERDGHGIFTEALLKALHGTAADERGDVTVEGISQYIKDYISEDQVPESYGFNRLPRFVIASSNDWSQATQQQRAEEAQRQREARSRQQALEALLADHSGFMNALLESFVGRERELQQIRAAIAVRMPTGGYVTITGQAGQGKSSVIARLVEEYGRDNVAYHFIPLNPGPDHQVELLRNLMARLILKYDLSDIYVASDS